MYLSDQQKEEICARACDGQTLKDICAEMGIGYRSLWKYRQENPPFDQTLARALQAGVDAQVDELLTLHKHEPDPQRLGKRSDNIKWVASRRYRAAYGDAIDVTVNERVDISGALIEARKRASLPDSDQHTLEHSQVTEYTDITDAGPSDYESRDDQGGSIFD